MDQSALLKNVGHISLEPNPVLEQAPVDSDRVALAQSRGDRAPQARRPFWQELDADELRSVRLDLRLHWAGSRDPGRDPRILVHKTVVVTRPWSSKLSRAWKSNLGEA
jgi:hypothetical protein